jgi:hypothetical protein
LDSGLRENVPADEKLTAFFGITTRRAALIDPDEMKRIAGPYISYCRPPVEPQSSFALLWTSTDIDEDQNEALRWYLRQHSYSQSIA